MSVKGMIRRAATCALLVVTLFWITVITTSDEETQEQPQVIMPEASGAKQRRVMDVDDMCKLLNTRRLERENPYWSPEKTTIRTIRISMNEMCAKEKEFEDKAVSVTETVDGKDLEIVYLEISTWHEDAGTSTVIESKHIQALHKFLQMFAGRRIGNLSIYNTKMTQEVEELQRIKHILDTNPWIDIPISVKELWVCSTSKTTNAHPVVLQVVLQAMGDIGAGEEKAKSIYINIAERHVGQTIQLLGGLKCKKLETLSIEIEAKEPPVGGGEAIGLESDWVQTVQESNYELEILKISSQTDKCSVTLPTWLLRKPRVHLSLNMYQYMCLDKKEIQSIRALILSVNICDNIDRQSIEKDTAQKNSEGITNELVEVLHIFHLKNTNELFQTKKEFLEYQRSCLAWIATQFPCLTKIQIDSINRSDYIQAISMMGVVFSPRIQNLEEVILDRKELLLHESEDMRLEEIKNDHTILRTMPFVIRPKLWQAFASGQMEVQINKQLGLKEGQEEYIRMQPSESEKNTEKFSCPICQEDFSKNDESSWIYVTGPCRHAFCLVCLNACANSENPICYLDNAQILKNWGVCWRIEEMGKDTYSMTLSQVEEESNENVQIVDFLAGRKTMVVEYQSNKSTRWFETPSRMLAALWYKK